MPPYTGLLDQFGRPLQNERQRMRRRPVSLRAIVDLAQTTTENERHWARADGLSSGSANSPDVRKKTRDRSRYECLNNSYCRGFVSRLSNDNIGTGPRWQLRIPDVSEDDIRETEDRYAGWATDVDLAEKYRVMDESTIRDGECFGLLTTNELITDAVKLDVRLIEADQVATPGIGWGPDDAVDGIVFDRSGNPVEYHVLKEHPGDSTWSGTGTEYDRVPAELVLHWLTPSRPGEVRALPEITPALPLFAQLRRYTLAVLMTAENAAQISGVLETDLPPVDGGAVGAEDADDDEMEVIPAVRGAYMTLPRGFKLNGHKPEQPTTEMGGFVKLILCEIGCVIQAPLSVVTGNDNDSSYSGGRLNLLPYHRRAWIRRARFKARVADRVLRAWYAEAVRVPDYLPANLPDISLWSWEWQWDGFDSIDPVKEATTDGLELDRNTVTLSEICARKGTDWKAVLRQRAVEQQLANELGLVPVATAKPARPQAERDTVLEDEEEAAYVG